MRCKASAAPATVSEITAQQATARKRGKASRSTREPGDRPGSLFNHFKASGKTPGRFHMLRLIAGFLAGCCLSVCYAQDDQIVVTATRFPDSKRDLPVGVTVITADDIRNSASSSLGDILAQFGLLQIRDLAGTQNPQVDLRGFGITGDQNTLILVDGLRINESDLESAQLSAIPLDSIERIEIVRGGGAVLYGAGATGGTINIITRRARPGEVRALALGRAGGYGTEEVRGSYAHQGDTFGGGIAASYEDTDGYRSNGRYRQRSALGRVDALFPTGRAYLKLGVDEQRQRLPGALTEAEINADPRQTKTPDDWRERDGAQVWLGGTKAIGRHELSADLGYRQRTTKAFFAAFGGFFTDTDANLWSFNPRAKLAFDALGRTHDLIVGGDFERWDYDTLSASSPSTTSAAFSRRHGEQENVGWYALTNLWVAQRTRLVLGARTQRIAQRLTEEVFPDDERRRSRRGVRERAAAPARRALRHPARERDLLQSAHVLERQPVADRAAGRGAGGAVARERDARPARRVRPPGGDLQVRRLRRRRCERQDGAAGARNALYGRCLMGLHAARPFQSHPAPRRQPAFRQRPGEYLPARDTRVHAGGRQAGAALRAALGPRARGEESLRQGLFQLWHGDRRDELQRAAGPGTRGLPVGGLAARLRYPRGMVRDAVPLGECSRALVVKLRHHGDVLLAAPVLSALKAHAPRLEIDAVVYDDTAPMLQGHPALAELHRVGRDWRELNAWRRLAEERSLLRALRARGYDLLVHLTEHPRGAWLARLLGVRYSVAPRVPDRGTWWRGSFTHLYAMVPNRHQVELNLDALRRIGVYPGPSERKVHFVPGAAAERAVAQLPLPEAFVHLHPASRWTFKCWPAERNAQLADRLAAEGHPVVLTAAPQETDFIDQILAKTASKPLNLAGKLSLKELGALTARARLFIGVDSMPMHLAAAMGTPTVALFGPSSENVWGPWNVERRVVTSTHSCRPCGIDGCGGGKVSECLTLLPVDAVHAAARELLAPAA